MEKNGEDCREERLKYQTAIRCAKAAILLSSLKNAAKNSTTDLPQFQDEENIEKLKKLKMEVVKKKQKLKQLKYWIAALVMYYFLIVAIYPLVLNSVWFMYL